MLNRKTFIIAEAGVNHNGKIKLAYQLIDAAKKAGADFVGLDDILRKLKEDGLI